MRIPSATYRLQFTPAFGFEQAREIIPYLRDLGISDLYASPIFHARPGSTHGYDVINPNALNPELGSPENFAALTAETAKFGLGWLQDIVPNHMAFDHGNPYLVDVLENGGSSRYFRFFDITWDHFYDIFRDRVLAPFLGSFYGEALEGGEVRLAYDQEGFAVHYFSLRFPLRIESYLHLLTPCLEALRKRLGEENPDYIQLLGVLYVLETLHTEPGALDRYNQIKFIKNTLWNFYRKSGAIRQEIDRTVASFHGRTGDPESFSSLDALLAEQNFRLSFWKVAAEEINYRRFFSINDLISLQAERPEVFAETHQFLLSLVAEGRFTGLRIDHIDGLCDPAQYLARLREKAGDCYLLVEKITAPGEPLPDWPVQGTTGYEFMNRVGGLFCRRENAKAFSRLYTGFTGLEAEFEDMVYEKKKLIAERHMMGDINNLAHLLKNIASRHRYGSDITMYSLRRSLMEIMACFPVYRTYFQAEGGRDADRKYIRQAIQEALSRNPGLVNEFNYLQKILSLEVDEFLPEEERGQWLHFIMRLQQFTGPLMAKGFEDTLLYVYARLLSLNEVGGTPEHFGFTAEEFNAYCRRRQAEWPLALSATATHDHKRGEDVRARLHVLSEIPQEWGRQIKLWRRLNRRHKGRIGRRKMPSANDEYFLYQTLIGTWPFGDFDPEEYLHRIREYAVKAVREAKIYTAWVKPDQEYEQVFLRFIERILAPSPDNEFLPDFIRFQRRIAHLGIFNALGQQLIKITAPGVPDIYQGTELWDFSLVDPDNRRPVDFARRRQLLASLQRQADSGLPELLQEMLSRPEDGRLKLFLLWRALAVRRRLGGLFREGDYSPLAAEGKFAGHVFAFARQNRESCCVTLVPRFLTGLLSEEGLPFGRETWEDTWVSLPGGDTCQWRNAMTGSVLSPNGKHRIAEILEAFPVALLTLEMNNPPAAGNSIPGD